MIGKLFKQKMLSRVCLQTVKAVALSLLLGSWGIRSASGDETTNETGVAMYCSQCGKEIVQSAARFCPQCGAPLPQVPARPPNDVAGNEIAATESIQTDWGCFFSSLASEILQARQTPPRVTSLKV